VRNFGISTNPPEGVCHGRLPTPRRDLGNTPVPKSRRGFSSSADRELAAAVFSYAVFIAPGVILGAFLTGYYLFFA
jgi:hypothetical protein